MTFIETTKSRRCKTCGRSHYAPRATRAEAPLPLFEWGARQPQRLALKPPARPTLRLHLSMAAEARRRGDYGAAAIHETDAILAQRAEQATARRMLGVPR